MPSSVFSFIPKHGTPSRASLLGLLLAASVLASCRQGDVEQQSWSGRTPETNLTAPVNAPSRQASSFPAIYDRVSPAVVSINAARIAQAPEAITDFFAGPRGGQPIVLSMSAGSGFFISPEGHILTNNHVVGEANQVSVVLRDGRELPARLVGRDPASDLAVLKVDGRDFPHVTFSAAANPRVGEAVIAIGNPYGLGTTATHGIVSAYGRDIGSPFVDFIQLDAPINQGNSGGPTFNEQGEVVGVNTAIFSPSGGSVGIGFAIPAAIARNVAQQLIRSGRVERGFIGASLLDLPADSPLGASPGVGVAAVVVGGPAARAGLRPGDIIQAVGGKQVDDAADVIRRIVSAEAGQSLSFSLLRNGRTATVDVRVQHRPS